MTDIKPTGLALLRVPFPSNAISKLPKPTKAQTDKVKADFKTGIRCNLCGAWHHKDVVHLDYVGHAALTDRLLDCDPEWNWEPVTFDDRGMPALDQTGGMWIRLTVCGVTRLGYGDADGKTGGNAVKERIGDALRNAAMRFGAALDLWHKGDLHADLEDVVADTPNKEASVTTPRGPSASEISTIKGNMIAAIDGTKSSQELTNIKDNHKFKADLAWLRDADSGAAEDVMDRIGAREIELTQTGENQ